MTRLLVATTIAAAALLPGCMPLEQAPLVYSSKQQMGVAVVAGTADSPGLDINIGYKGLDAAFVPVAVAKKCDAAAASDCRPVSYDIQIVQGTNKLSGQSALDQKLIQQYLAAIDADNKRIAELSEQIRSKTESIAEIDSLLSKQQDLAKYAVVDGTGAPIVLTAAQIGEKARLEAEIARIQKLGSKATLQQDLVALNALNKAAAIDLAERTSDLHAITARRNEQTGDDKSDAFSVYGSFDGNASGASDGAGLRLGKVFSTGIAAQNISQGINSASRTDAVTRCVTVGSAMIAKAATGQEKLMADLIAACNAHERPR